MSSSDSKPRRPFGGPAEETPPEIHWRLEKWFPEIPAPQRAALKNYHTELMKFNKAINLIGVKTVPVADALHFADSVLASRMIAGVANIPEIYDFGSGNGFPGLVYALLQPATRVHLIEVDGRKAEFMKHVISVMKLTNADVRIQGVESLPEKSVRYAMSRGFAPIPKALLLARKIFDRGGMYFHLKSEEWASEIAQIPTQLCSFWSPSLLGEYKLPIGEIRFAIVKTEKIGD